MRFKSFGKSFRRFAKKNASAALALAGMAGVVVTAYFVAKETPKAMEKLEANPDASTAEKVGLMVGSYPKSIISGATTIGCIGAAKFMDSKEIMALGGIAATQFRKDKIKDEVLKEELDNETYAKVDKKVMNMLVGDDFVEAYACPTGHGSILCYESYFGHFFYASQNWIEKVAYEVSRMNDKAEEEWIPFKEWYDELGIILPENIEGLDCLGFPNDPSSGIQAIDPVISGCKTVEGTPFLIVNYRIQPEEVHV